MNILLLSPDNNSNDHSALKITNSSTELCENEVIINEVIEEYICFSALLNLILDSQIISEM